MQTWNQAQQWEKNWHGDCINSYQEESKQIEYAKRMGLTVEGRDGRYPVIDFNGQSVVDIGGGPYSLLLKGINFKSATVVDPLPFPEWVYKRYEAAGIKVIRIKAEDFFPLVDRYDVGLIYNVLQHVENPEKVIKNMKHLCTVIYLHEWLETPVSDGHINTLHEKELNEWLDDTGLIGFEQWSPTVITPYYYGIFI